MTAEELTQEANKYIDSLPESHGIFAGGFIRHLKDLIPNIAVWLVTNYNISKK